jgi:hypothetical protein
MKGPTAPVDRKSLLWTAWETYKKDDEYHVSKYWAARSPDYIEGGMWAAFVAGFDLGRTMGEHKMLIPDPKPRWGGAFVWAAIILGLITVGLVAYCSP